MLWSLARDNSAPELFGRLSKNHIPLYAMIFTMCCSLIALAAEKWASSKVYLTILSVAGMAGILGWMAICLAQYNFRRRYIASGKKLEDLKYRTPFFPIVPFLDLGINTAVIIGSWFDTNTRIGVIAIFPFTILLIICYYLFVASRRTADQL